MSDKVVLAIPSKGELHERTLRFLDACGMQVRTTGYDREYVGRLSGIPEASVIFLRAEEIPIRLERGDVHIGITGEDLHREHADGADLSHVLVKELGYGHARVLVAVPSAWVDVQSMMDLEEVALSFRQCHMRALRVATKFPRLTRNFFARLGISDYRIVPSLGATEGAPASGLADIIVDISSTGATLAQNHLKALPDGTLLASQACLVVAARPDNWCEASLAVLTNIVERIEANRRAAGAYMLRFNAPRRAIGPLELELRTRLLGEARPHEQPTDAEPREAARLDLALVCASDRLHAVTRILRDAGCDQIVATRADFVFAEPSAAVDGFRYLLRRLHPETR